MFNALSGNGSLPAALREYRNTAWEAYSSLGMPTTKDEPWRRTDLRGMPAGSFRLPDAQNSASL